MSPQIAHLRTTLRGWWQREPGPALLGLGYGLVSLRSFGADEVDEMEMVVARALIHGTFGIALISVLAAPDRRGVCASPIAHPALPLTWRRRLVAELAALAAGLGVIVAALLALGVADPAPLLHGWLVMVAVAPLWARWRGQGLLGESVGVLIAAAVAVGAGVAELRSPGLGSALAAAVFALALALPPWTPPAVPQRTAVPVLRWRPGLSGVARLRRDWLRGLGAAGAVLALALGFALSVRVSRVEDLVATVAFCGVGLALAVGIGMPFATMLQSVGRPGRSAWMWLPVPRARVARGLYVHGAVVALGVPLVLGALTGVASLPGFVIALLWVGWVAAAYTWLMTGHLVQATALLVVALVLASAGIVLHRHQPEWFHEGVWLALASLGPAAALPLLVPARRPHE